MTYHDNHPCTITEPHVHPEDFGAVGDSITDDRAAIQKALDSGVQVIFAASKGYRIDNSDGPLMIDSKDREK
jgi:hypothetical protein